MTTKITPPAPLDNTRLYTRAEYRQWQREMFAYQAALDEEAQEQERKAKAKEAGESGIMPSEEFDAIALKLHEEQLAREASREAERQAAADAKALYLASSPDIAVISETSPYLFLCQVTHWASQGYTVSETADIHILPTYFSASMNKPAAAKKAK